LSGAVSQLSNIVVPPCFFRITCSCLDLALGGLFHHASTLKPGIEVILCAILCPEEALIPLDIGLVIEDLNVGSHILV
jgi:hypothetical protein